MFRYFIKKSVFLINFVVDLISSGIFASCRFFLPSSAIPIKTESTCCNIYKTRYNHKTINKFTNYGELKMKKVVMLSLIVFTAILLNGCISPIPSGTIYSGATMPHSAPATDMSYTKNAVSYSHSVLGLIAWGDGGISSAVKKGNIKTLKIVDYNIYNIVCLYMLYRTEVYGD
jgi:hypothetical protein